MSPSRPGWSRDPMSPTGAGSHLDLQVEQQTRQDVDSRLSQVPKAHPPPPPGGTDSPYPYYPPREGEVVWPAGSMDPSQHSYMGPGPSRLPYDPGAFAYGDQGQSSSSTRPPSQHQQQPSSSPYPPLYPLPLDRAFDSGNYHGMISPSTDPSTNILTPGYQSFNSSQQHLRSGDQYPFSSTTTSDRSQIPRNQLSQSQSQSGYPYPPEPRAPPQEGRTSRRQSKRLNEGLGEWSGPDYNQMGVQPGPSYRPFMPPNLDPAYYPPFPGQAGISPEPHQDPTSPRRSASTSSPQDAGRRSSGRRKSGIDIMEDEEDWSHLPESERALAKLDKRRGQNKIAQRAFRARTRMNKAQTSNDLAHLTDLTQSQAKRLDDMTILVATLQRENAELRMAAMNAQQPPPHTTLLESESKDRPLTSHEPTASTSQTQDEQGDHNQLSPSRNKRPARSRNSS